MKPHEHFICQNCYEGIDQEGSYDCRVHPELNRKISFNSPACEDFNPRSSCMDSYKIYVLEERVKKLENTIYNK